MAHEVIHIVEGQKAEARLVLGLREGDPAAYRQLYAVFAPRISGTLLRIFRDQHLADEAVQATFLTVFRKIDQFDGRSALATWMTRIAIREAQRMLYKNKGMSRTAQALSAQPDQQEASESPEERHIDADLFAKVKGLIDGLPDDKRIPLLLFEVEGLAVQEIADLLNLPRGTVLSRLSRTRAELREAAKGICEGLTQTQMTQMKDKNHDSHSRIR